MKRRDVLRSAVLGPAVIGAGTPASAVGAEDASPIPVVCVRGATQTDAGRHVAALNKVLGANGTVQALIPGRLAPTLLEQLDQDPVWALASCLPFGLDAQTFVVWWLGKGGQSLFNQYLSHRYGLTALLTDFQAQQPFAEMSSRISTLSELTGRITAQGMFARELARALGLSTNQASAAQASAGQGESGYAYFPVWWSPPVTTMLLVDHAHWAGFGSNAQHNIRLACNGLALNSLAANQAAQFAGLGGESAEQLNATARLMPFPGALLFEAEQVVQQMWATHAANCESFAAIYESQQAIREQAVVVAGVTSLTQSSVTLSVMG